MLAAVNLRNLGARVRLHAADGDDLGLAYAPAPVAAGRRTGAADGGVWVVTALVDLGEPGDALDALAEVEPDEPSAKQPRAVRGEIVRWVPAAMCRVTEDEVVEAVKELVAAGEYRTWRLAQPGVSRRCGNGRGSRVTNSSGTGSGQSCRPRLVCV
jgi:hypothetical protein